MKHPILILLAIGLTAFILGSLAITPISQAQQPTPRPTATNIGAGKHDTDDNEEVPPTPLAGGVQGYVYNYSSGGIAQPGITVVLDGGGWQAEAPTDSNGFYQFAGLGSSQATLNLRLPPGAHPVMPDWPIHTSKPEPGGTNLGFYWGDTPPLPVLLFVDPVDRVVPVNQEFSLEINVRNQSGGVASEGVVDLQLPVGLGATQATVTHGRVDFTEHRIWGLLGEVPNGDTASLTVKAVFDEPIFPQDLTARVIFNYQEQLTPQLVRLNITGSQPAAPPSSPPVEGIEGGTDPLATEGKIEGGAEATPQTQIPTTGGDEVTHQPEVPTPILAGESQGAQQTVQSGSQPADQSQNTQSTHRPSSAPVDSTTIETNVPPVRAEGQIPVTGEITGPALSAWPVLLLSILAIIGLGVAGLRAFSRQK